METTSQIDKVYPLQESLIKELISSVTIMSPISHHKGWHVKVNIYGYKLTCYIGDENGNIKYFDTLDSAVKKIYELGFQSDIRISHYDNN